MQIIRVEEGNELTCQLLARTGRPAGRSIDCCEPRTLKWSLAALLSQEAITRRACPLDGRVRPVVHEVFFVCYRNWDRASSADHWHRLNAERRLQQIQRLAHAAGGNARRACRVNRPKGEPAADHDFPNGRASLRWLDQNRRRLKSGLAAEDARAAPFISRIRNMAAHGSATRFVAP